MVISPGTSHESFESAISLTTGCFIVRDEVSGVKTQIGTPQSSNATTLKARQSVSAWSLDFYRNTTIHGLKYLRERHHRPFWVIVMIVSLVFSINSIYELWVEWDRYKMITNEIGDLTKSDVQFPAVTICSEALVNTDVLNLSQIDPQNAEE